MLHDDLSRAFPQLRTSHDEADRVAYARDLWPRHHLEVRSGNVAEHKPGAIVWPESTEDVAALVKWAHQTGTPLVPFGAGRGVCAGILPRADVVIVDLKRMTKWRRFDRDAPFLEVEAGHMGVPLEDRLNREGFTLGHFPSSILCSTVGGWVAARSAGQCSGYYGKIEDMVAEVECVTGTGEVVTLKRRTSAPNLVPLVVGSEGTLAIVTSATLRLHPVPTSRAFSAWSFPTTEHGWEAMRAMFQSGLRPAVARLYDPFDAMLARMGGVKAAKSAKHAAAKKPGAPGMGQAALRSMLRRPGVLNDLVNSQLGERALGGAMLLVIFEGTGETPSLQLEAARAIAGGMSGTWEGEGPARRWLQHRYSVSYRQAPVFASGAFVDTIEVAATWSRLGALYDGVRRALGQHAFVMAHFSHAYPDGCCIYFSFAGSAAKKGKNGWDAACEEQYDAAWRGALKAAVDAGGTLAHHHGVGRSKAPRVSDELGSGGVAVVRSLMKAFDPKGILNPGNLVPTTPTPTATTTAATATATATATANATAATATATATANATTTARMTVDRTSLLLDVDARETLASAESFLAEGGLTLDLARGTDLSATVADWLARGAPGSRDAWLDPADQLLAGLVATLADGTALSIRPTPRRATGPDLIALIVGCGARFAVVTRACLRVHKTGAPRPRTAPFTLDRDPTSNEGEQRMLDAIEQSLRAR